MAKIKIVGETPGRYTKVFNSIIRSPFLTPAEKATYLYLVSMPPEASVSHSDIASAVGVSRNSASTYVASLEQKGVLTSRRHGTASRSYISQYTIRVNPEQWSGWECQKSGQLTENEDKDTLAHRAKKTSDTENEEPKSLADGLAHCAKTPSTNVPKTRACIEDYISKKTKEDYSSSSSFEKNSDPSESSRPDTTSEKFTIAWDSLQSYPRVGDPSTCKEIYSQLVSEGKSPEKIAEGVAAVAENFEGDEKFRPGLKRVLETGQWEKELVKDKKKKLADEKKSKEWDVFEKIERRQAGKEQ